MNWREKFEQLRSIDPVHRHLEDNVSSDFYDVLYETFKARLEEERNERRG